MKHKIKNKLAALWHRFHQVKNELAWKGINKAIHIQPHSDIETVIYGLLGLSILTFAILLNFELHVVAALFLGKIALKLAGLVVMIHVLFSYFHFSPLFPWLSGSLW